MRARTAVAVTAALIARRPAVVAAGAVTTNVHRVGDPPGGSLVPLARTEARTQMSDTDPHIHVDRKVLEAGPAVRNLLSSVLGRVTDAPGVVTTGCGLDVPYAMTSPRPESVTCLACREHAHREYLRFADQVERLGRPGQIPGTDITGDQVAQAVARLRDLARRFAG